MSEKDSAAREARGDRQIVERLAREMHWNGVEDRVRVIADALEMAAELGRGYGQMDACAEKDARIEELRQLLRTVEDQRDMELNHAVQAEERAELAEAERDEARAAQATAEAERDMLRGVDCLAGGDGPCGCCVKCLRLRAETAEAALAQSESSLSDSTPKD